MHMHSSTLGHVAFAIPATAALESAEEAYEIAMLRCHYGSLPFLNSPTLPSRCAPEVHHAIYNPNTLRDLAYIFETTLEHAFARWGTPAYA